MLNKDNYVSWSSRLIRYAKSKPNGKLLVNSIKNGPYVRRIIHEPGDPNGVPPVVESTHEQTDDELTEKEVKQMEADDQEIQTILVGLLKDIYAVVDSCDTTQEIWLHVEQMMKGSRIGVQEKKAKLFNEWEKFSSTEGESIESYYHRFSKLMNDFSRNKYFSEKIASNLKRIAHWGMNTGQDRQIQVVGGNGGNQFRQYAGKNAGNQIGYNVGHIEGHHIGYNAIQNVRNQNVNQNENGNVVAERVKGHGNGNNSNQIRCYNCRGLGHLTRNCTVRPRRRDAAYLQTELLIA
ncbi:retrovirus-related pol polyprotein from transposon TNT 1-94 [Tanacetum coccineum]